MKVTKNRGTFSYRYSPELARVVAFLVSKGNFFDFKKVTAAAQSW